MSKEELKTCPFCGGQARKVIDLAIHCEVTSCRDCGARGPVKYESNKVNIDWNTRRDQRLTPPSE